jgi:N-acetylglucosamine-6-phosphate deacetylase
VEFGDFFHGSFRDLSETVYPLSLQANGGPLFTDGAWSGYVAFDQPGLTLAKLEAVARYYYSLGYGYFCPTMVTSSAEAYQSNLPIFRAARDFDWGQGILPPHLEGPFFSPDCMGAHNPKLRQEPTPAFAEKLISWSQGFLGFLTMAPERPGALETIRFLTAHGVSVSLGHMNPVVEEIQAALEAGASAFTHVLNAATRDKLSAKDLRMVAQFTDRRAWSMIIPDAVHVPAYAVQLMAQSKGPDKVIFVADESPLIGAPAGTTAELWGQRFEIRHDDAGRLRSFELSGSCTTLIECMNIALEWGVPRPVVEAAVTANAAAFLSPALHRCGVSLTETPTHTPGVVFNGTAYVPGDRN